MLILEILFWVTIVFTNIGAFILFLICDENYGYGVSYRECIKNIINNLTIGSIIVFVLGLPVTTIISVILSIVYFSESNVANKIKGFFKYKPFNKEEE